jgi:hypothetical protein
MKLPNGYGSVVKLKGNRRRPFAVRKTAGFDEKGHPVQVSLGYAATREEGLAVLAAYNRDPWDVDGAKITLAELFELWKEKKAPKLGLSNRNGLCSSYRHCLRYADKRYREIRKRHMQECIDECGRSYSTQGVVKNLWAHLDDFAAELDIPSAAAQSASKAIPCRPRPATVSAPKKSKSFGRTKTSLGSIPC